MKNESGTLLLFILLVLVFKDFGPSDGPTSVYFAYCADRTQRGAHCPASTVGPHTQFRAIPSVQTVFSLEEGIVYHLQECTVFDAKNWACAQPGFPQSMTDGEYQAPWETMTTQRVSWVHWEFLRLKDWAIEAPKWTKRLHVCFWLDHRGRQLHSDLGDSPDHFSSSRVAFPLDESVGRRP